MVKTLVVSLLYTNLRPILFFDVCGNKRIVMLSIGTFKHGNPLVICFLVSYDILFNFTYICNVLWFLLVPQFDTAQIVVRIIICFELWHLGPNLVC